MTHSTLLTKENLSATILAIKTFEESKKFKDEELETLAEKAILLQKTSDSDWLISELVNFHDNQKKEEENQKVKLIKPSKPVKIKDGKDLKKVLDAHKTWMDSVLNFGDISSGTRANLSSADLSGMTLEDVHLNCANLNGASFIGAKLNKVTFSRASLKKTSFQGAIIKNCTFHKTDLEGADFTEADITDSSFTDEQKKTAFGLF